MNDTDSLRTPIEDSASFESAFLIPELDLDDQQNVAQKRSTILLSNEGFQPLSSGNAGQSLSHASSSLSLNEDTLFADFVSLDRRLANTSDDEFLNSDSGRAPVHDFIAKTYKTPTLCAECNKLLWGLVRQGIHCNGCGANLHVKCAGNYYGAACPLNGSTSNDKRRSSGIAALSILTSDSNSMDAAPAMGPSMDEPVAVLRRPVSASALIPASLLKLRRPRSSTGSLPLLHETGQASRGSETSNPPTAAASSGRSTGSVLHRAYTSLLEQTAQAKIEKSLAAGGGRLRGRHGSYDPTAPASRPSSQPSLAGPPLALFTTMPYNLQRFVSRIGPIFVLQGRIEEILNWKSTSESLLYLAVYIAICLHPPFLLLAPYMLPIAILVRSHYLYTVRKAAQQVQAQTHLQSANIFKRKNAAAIAAAEPRRPPTSVAEYKHNLKGIQNMMGIYCDAHDAFSRKLREVRGSEGKIILQAWTCIAAIMVTLHIVPLRYLFLVGGSALMLSGSTAGKVCINMFKKAIQPHR